MKHVGLLAGVVLAISGCASTGWPTVVEEVALLDLPERFVVAAANAAAAAPAPAPASCYNPLLDPRDGTRLVLERSSGGFGDYSVAPVRYGLAANQLLRVSCSDGKAVGAVQAR